MYNAKHNLLVESLNKYSNIISKWGVGLGIVFFLIGCLSITTDDYKVIGVYMLSIGLSTIITSIIVSLNVEVKATQIELLIEIANKEKGDKN